MLGNRFSVFSATCCCCCLLVFLCSGCLGHELQERQLQQQKLPFSSDQLLVTSGALLAASSYLQYLQGKLVLDPSEISIISSTVSLARASVQKLPATPQVHILRELMYTIDQIITIVPGSALSSPPPPPPTTTTPPPMISNSEREEEKICFSLCVRAHCDVSDLTLCVPAAEVPPPPPELSLVGCFNENNRARVVAEPLVLMSRILSVDTCMSLAVSRSMRVVAMQRGSCYGTSDPLPQSFLVGARAPDSACGLSCPGAPSQRCGGIGQYVSVYVLK